MAVSDTPHQERPPRMTSTDTTRILIDSLKDAHSLKEQPRRLGLDKIVFGVAALLAVGFVAWGVISPTSLGSVAASALEGTMNNLGWLFVSAATIFTSSSLWDDSGGSRSARTAICPSSAHPRGLR